MNKALTIGAVAAIVIVAAAVAFVLYDDGVGSDTLRTELEVGDYIEFETYGGSLDGDPMGKTRISIVAEYVDEDRYLVQTEFLDFVYSTYMSGEQFLSHIFCDDASESFGIQMEDMGVEIVSTAFGDRECVRFVGKDTSGKEITSFIGKDNKVGYLLDTGGSTEVGTTSLRLISTSLFGAAGEGPAEDVVRTDLEVGDYLTYGYYTDDSTAPFGTMKKEIVADHRDGTFDIRITTGDTSMIDTVTSEEFVSGLDVNGAGTGSAIIGIPVHDAGSAIVSTPFGPMRSTVYEGDGIRAYVGENSGVGYILDMQWEGGLAFSMRLTETSIFGDGSDDRLGTDAVRSDVNVGDYIELRQYGYVDGGWVAETMRWVVDGIDGDLLTVTCTIGNEMIQNTMSAEEFLGTLVAGDPSDILGMKDVSVSGPMIIDTPLGYRECIRYAGKDVAGNTIVSFIGVTNEVAYSLGYIGPTVAVPVMELIGSSLLTADSEVGSNDLKGTLEVGDYMTWNLYVGTPGGTPASTTTMAIVSDNGDGTFEVGIGFGDLTLTMTGEEFRTWAMPDTSDFFGIPLIKDGSEVITTDFGMVMCDRFVGEGGVETFVGADDGVGYLAVFADDAGAVQYMRLVDTSLFE